MWSKIDFIKNKAYWENNQSSISTKIREDNLKEIVYEFDLLNVTVFLEGKTLFSLYFFHKLNLNDHDDDLGVFYNKKNITIIKNQIIPSLKKKKFKVIRFNQNMISFEKDLRYIDVCFFRKKGGSQIGYSNKTFSLNYYKRLNKVKRLNYIFYIPRNTFHLLLQRYFKWYIVVTIKKIFKPPYFYAKGLINSVSTVKILTKENFLNLEVESKKSLNWIIRKNHLDVVTNSCKNILVKDIIEYFRKIDLDEFEKEEIITSQLNQTITEPINLSKEFWQSGNNYFFNCLKYRFRKNVLEYKLANNYIKKKIKPTLYSSKYFSELQEMKDFEVAEFLKNNPIEIKNNHVISGRHRVYAMIGRLIYNEKYIKISYHKKI